MPQPNLRIVSNEDLPAWKKKVTHRARPSTLVLSKEPQMPRPVTLGVAVRCVHRDLTLWQKVKYLVGGVFFLWLLCGALAAIVRSLS